MNVLKAKLDYWTDTRFSNSPSAQILVEEAPVPSEYRYEYKKAGGGGHRIYYAEQNGFVSFFFARGPYELIDYNLGTKQEPMIEKVWASKQDEGYARRHFVLTMKNGETHVLRGPWSSNSHAVREAGFPTCVEVTYTDDPKVWEKGYTFYSGAVNRDMMKEISLALPKDDDMHSWVWVESELHHLMPGLVKSSHDRLAGAIYSLTEE